MPSVRSTVNEPFALTSTVNDADRNWFCTSATSGSSPWKDTPRTFVIGPTATGVPSSRVTSRRVPSAGSTTTLMPAASAPLNAMPDATVSAAACWMPSATSASVVPDRRTSRSTPSTTTRHTSPARSGSAGAKSTPCTQSEASVPRTGVSVAVGVAVGSRITSNERPTPPPVASTT